MTLKLERKKLMRCFIYYDLNPSDQAQTCFLMSKSEGDKRRFPIDFYTTESLFAARATTPWWPIKICIAVRKSDRGTAKRVQLYFKIKAPE